MAKTARKTIEVGTLLHRVNYFLKNDRGSVDEREIMIAFIEGVLHDSGNYRGFAYLPAEDYPGEVDGLGTRRRYFVSGTVDADYEAAAALIQKHYPARGV
jgi:hypothetical protein